MKFGMDFSNNNSSRTYFVIIITAGWSGMVFIVACTAVVSKFSNGPA